VRRFFATGRFGGFGERNAAWQEKEDHMSVVVVNTMTGGDVKLYEAVNGKVMPEKDLPEGCQVHIAGPTGDGWRVITVWDSEDAFNRFREAKLIPAIREEIGDQAVAPRVEADEVHTLITA
jgi:hypothetical protein